MNYLSRLINKNIRKVQQTLATDDHDVFFPCIFHDSCARAGAGATIYTQTQQI